MFDVQPLNQPARRSFSEGVSIRQMNRKTHTPFNALFYTVLAVIIILVNRPS